MSCFAEETFLYLCTCLTYTGGEMHVMLLTQHQYSISLLYENVNFKNHANTNELERAPR